MKHFKTKGSTQEMAATTVVCFHQVFELKQLLSRMASSSFLHSKSSQLKAAAGLEYRLRYCELRVMGASEEERVPTGSVPAPHNSTTSRLAMAERQYS